MCEDCGCHTEEEKPAADQAEDTPAETTEAASEETSE